MSQVAERGKVFALVEMLGEPRLGCLYVVQQSAWQVRPDESEC
jgi:hypothetical protein